MYSIEEFEKFAREGAYEMSKNELEKDGQLIPLVCIVSLKDPKTGEYHKEGKTFMSVIRNMDGFSDATSKEMFSRFIRMMSAKLESVAILMVFESWILEGNSLTDPVPTDISTHPDRKEIVMFVLEHSQYEEGTKLLTAEITRKDGKPILGPIGDSSKSYCKSSGRFTNILNEQNVTHKAQA